MATTRPFAYNPGAPISGTTQVGDLAIGDVEQDYSLSPGGVIWWMGPDEDLGYVICVPVPSNTQPTEIPGVTASVGFFRSDALTNNSFINLVNVVFNQNFSTPNDAKNYLTTNGYWTSFDSPLLLSLDAGNPSSYSGTGNIWYDLSGNNNDATLINLPTYSSAYTGILEFDNASLQTANIPNLGNLPTWSVEAWVRFTTVPISSNPNATSIVTNQYDGGSGLNFSIGTNNAPGSYNVTVGFFDGAWHNTTGFVPQANVWYQIVGTYDGSVLRQYINGTASGGTLNYNGVPQSGGQVRLMRRWDATPTSGDYCDGDLAIVNIYNSALSPSDVLTSYNNTFGRFIEPTPTPTTTNTPTLTQTPTPSITASQTQTPTVTPTSTVTPTPTSTPNTPITSNLVLYYDPSNPSSYSGSGTVLNDLSGNGLSGTLSNVTYTSPAFNFNGTSSTISVADNALLEPGSGDWTMEAWVNHTVIAGSSRIIFAKTNGGLSADWGYGLRTSSAGATFGEVGNGTTSLQSNTSTLSINTWYQVVAVWTNLTTNTFELFINGVSQGSKAHSFTSIKNTTNPLYIGSFNNGQFSQWLNGKVGIVRIYSSALTSSQVLQNYNANKSIYGL